MTDKIALWMGQPISEMPREEMEDVLADAYRRIAELEADLCESRCAHINDLAVSVSRLRKRASVWGRLFGT